MRDIILFGDCRETLSQIDEKTCQMCVTSPPYYGLRDYTNNDKIQIYYHDNNLGKGAAIHTALKYTSGDITIIQDADLEYDPFDYYKLL